jgi:predicted RND superfamily exporter protein
MGRRNRFLDSLGFALFLAGSYIIYWQLGKWVAIGVGLEVISVYLMISAKMNTSDKSLVG